MKKYILTAVGVVAFLASYAQKNDATLNKVTETYTLKPDGAIDYDYSKSMIYHTHYSFFTLFGETFVVYNPAFQKLTINECKTTQKDGTVVKAPDNAFNEVLPAGAANSKDYNGLREMVITHTGLEPDCTVDLSYSITGSPDGSPTLDIDRVIPIQGADIKEYNIVVNVPHGTKLDWSVSDSDVKPVIKENTYTWTFRNIPAAAGDYYAPASHKGQPRLSVTTAGSLEEALRPLTVETTDICEAPANVLDGKTTIEEKAEAIQKFIVENIATGNVAPALTGYRFRQCASVLASAFGTPAEKALAMAKLMRSAGIDAGVVVVFPKNIKTRNIANISKFIVKAGDKFYGIDKTGAYEAGNHADRDDLVDLAGNQVSVSFNPLVINDTVDVELSVKDGEVETNEGSVAKRGSYWAYTVPENKKGVDSWGMTQLNSKRTDWFEIKSPIVETDVFTIRLDGLTSLTKSCDFNLENAAGSVKLSIENAGSQVIIRREIKLDKSLYPPTEYQMVRALLLEWYSPAYRRLILR
ncbi:MAG: DUF3857 domain-containing protein [Muribaculaceae bacterium]|nr:DUF3857 domain-containing protein [Muribaculaceae bacterium]